MIALVATFQSRVAPNFVHSPTATLARIEDGRIAATESLDLSGTTTDERLALLKIKDVSALVCGGIDCELADALRKQNVQIIANVAGEANVVLAELAAGRLQEGFGIFRVRTPRGEPALSAQRVPAETGVPTQPRGAGENNGLLNGAKRGTAPDCLACERRVCLTGAPCDCAAETAIAAPLATGDPFGEILDVTADIAGESERALCRVAELVYFALGMNYRRLGLAFCVEMFSEAEILAKTLRRFFEVVPVCCRLNGAPGAGRSGGGRCGGEEDAALPCHPVEMANALNRTGTQLNVMAGLCMGADVVFAQASAAPVTTLFVKDRLLANNPIAALHSSHVLKRILQEV